jgi:hypothetical protein
MSGAVEGVDFIESSTRRVAFRTRTVMTSKHLADFAAGQPVEGADDVPRVTTPPARSYVDGVSGEALFRAFMASDVTRLTTTALPEEWPRMQPSYQQAWEDFAIRLLSQGGKA